MEGESPPSPLYVARLFTALACNAHRVVGPDVRTRLTSIDSAQPDHFIGTWCGSFLGRTAGGVARFDDQPMEGYENRFGFTILSGLEGAAFLSVDRWTWVMVRSEAGRMQIRAEGLFDILFVVDAMPGPGGMEDLWQRVLIRPSGAGLVILIEEPKGDHRSR